MGAADGLRWERAGPLTAIDADLLTALAGLPDDPVDLCRAAQGLVMLPDLAPAWEMPDGGESHPRLAARWQRQALSYRPDEALAERRFRVACGRRPQTAKNRFRRLSVAQGRCRQRRRAGLQQRQASLPPYLNAPRRITESLERLVQLYDAWGKPAQAAEWRKKLAAFQQANKTAKKKEAQP